MELPWDSHGARLPHVEVFKQKIIVKIGGWGKNANQEIVLFRSCVFLCAREILVYIGAWGKSANQEIVSFRSCVACVRAGEAKLCVLARRCCFRGWVSKRAFVLPRRARRALAYLACVLLKAL